MTTSTIHPNPIVQKMQEAAQAVNPTREQDSLADNLIRLSIFEGLKAATDLELDPSDQITIVEQTLAELRAAHGAMLSAVSDLKRAA